MDQVSQIFVAKELSGSHGTILKALVVGGQCDGDDCGNGGTGVRQLGLLLFRHDVDELVLDPRNMACFE